MMAYKLFTSNANVQVREVFKETKGKGRLVCEAMYMDLKDLIKYKEY